MKAVITESLLGFTDMGYIGKYCVNCVLLCDECECVCMCVCGTIAEQSSLSNSI